MKTSQALLYIVLATFGNNALAGREPIRVAKNEAPAKAAPAEKGLDPWEEKELSGEEEAPAVEEAVAPTAEEPIPQLQPLESPKLVTEEDAAPVEPSSLEKRVQSLESRVTAFEKQKKAPTVPSASPLVSDVDKVPPSERAAFLERLKIAGIIVARHGQAVDYRKKTVAQLRDLLKDLDQRVAPPSKAKPAPKKSQRKGT